MAVLEENVLAYLKHLFKKHAGPDGKWTSAQVRTFVRGVQNHDEAAEATAHLLSLPDLDFSGFLAYMTSVDSSITLPSKNEDLSLPLASYYVNSSHNTYLEGNQLSSTSSTSAYTNVLLANCKCLEIDLWDGSDSDSEVSSSDDEAVVKKTARKEKKKELGEKKKRSSRSTYDQIKSKFKDSVMGKEERVEGEEVEAAVVEPRVLHGYTLTKEVSFRDVCVAIREAYQKDLSPSLPLIVSLEVHCSAQQQGVVVDIMKEVWAGLLVAEPETGAEKLPSPNDLRGKILIKAKYVPPDSSLEKVENTGDGQASVDAAKPKKAPKIIPELSKLSNIRGVSFKSWLQPEATLPTHIFSLGENKLVDHWEKQREALLNHNKSHLLRVYPSGLRIDSSNINPIDSWAGGAQMVAMNFQNKDVGMMLNTGMFDGTGGYVLKPEGYLPGSKNLPKTTTLSLSLTFLAGQSIPLPTSDKNAKGFKPYIKVSVHFPSSSENGSEPLKARTRTHKGCNIDLEAEKLEFKNVPSLIEKLTFVRFTVRDDEIGRDDLAAWACVRLDRLAQGYRFIELRNANESFRQTV